MYTVKSNNLSSQAKPRLIKFLAYSAALWAGNAFSVSLLIRSLSMGIYFTESYASIGFLVGSSGLFSLPASFLLWKRQPRSRGGAIGYGIVTGMVIVVSIPILSFLFLQLCPRSTPEPLLLIANAWTFLLYPGILFLLPYGFICGLLSGNLWWHMRLNSCWEMPHMLESPRVVLAAALIVGISACRSTAEQAPLTNVIETDQCQETIFLQLKTGSSDLTLKDAFGTSLKEKDLDLLKRTGIRGEMEVRGYAITGKGPQSRAIIILQSGLDKPASLSRPDRSTIIYLQEETGWKKYPADAPTLSKAIHLWQDPSQPWYFPYQIEHEHYSQGGNVHIPFK